MKADFSELKRSQLDAALSRWRGADLPRRPPSGWIKAIREGLGMTASYLAHRLGVSVPTVIRLERSEAEDRITLATLRRVAEALDCELQYALVPRRPLQETLEQKANELAWERTASASHSMKLEAQATRPETVEVQARALAQNLLNGPRRNLWKVESERKRK